MKAATGSSLELDTTSKAINVLRITSIGYSVIVALTGLPIEYSVIVTLTGLSIGYSAIVTQQVSL